MITVATKLDVPIKLTFQSASRSSILGLGDIVIPGMVIALALRFDLWLHYHRQITYELTELKSESVKPGSGEVASTTETRRMKKKPAYIDVESGWADWAWTAKLSDIFASSQGSVVARSLSFKKPYFAAAMVGYGAGMLTTLAMLVVFQHGQPALLYLVPGVIISLFVTGLARGELYEMWIYTEDGSLDVEDVVVELDKDGRVVKEMKVVDGKVVDMTAPDGKDDMRVVPANDGAAGYVSTDRKRKRKRPFHVFSISLTAPFRALESESSDEKNNDKIDGDDGNTDDDSFSYESEEDESDGDVSITGNDVQ